MGKKTGFLDYPREDAGHETVDERIEHSREFQKPLNNYRLQTQAARCMDCGVPFCNWGCPVDNLIPEFNEFVYEGQWRAAYGTLQSTNNFPEFTGRVCPAPCEAACCAGVVEESISIKQVELRVVEQAFAQGWVLPNQRRAGTGRRIAVVGSGPAGLAAAAQLSLAGHSVVVFEKNEVLGGLLRLGIPDFKLDKAVVERRIDVMRRDGIEFRTGVNVGVDVTASSLLKEHDFLALAGGAEQPRELTVDGRNLSGVHFAMDFLRQHNRRVGGRDLGGDEISAKGKNVVVIGGGDTGSDCVGTSIRQGAASVTQIEILPRPPRHRSVDNPWPNWPQVFRTSTSQAEGCERLFSVATRAFVGDERLQKITAARVEWGRDDQGKWQMRDAADGVIERPAELALLAMGFVHPVKDGLLEELGLELDPRGNVKVDLENRTSDPRVFCCGDMATGQSLVVRAIADGRALARSLDCTIKGHTHLS